MADTTIKFLSLAGLDHYDEKMKAFIANADLVTLGIAQEEIKALEDLVGKLPDGATVSTIVEYINQKTEGIATNTALAELQAAVDSAVARITAIEGDYLKSADKTELEAKIKTNTDAITILNGTGEGSVTKTVDDAINKFATDVTDDAVVNSYKELIDWVAAHGSEAAEMVAAIEANEASIADLKALVGTLPEGETSENIVAFIQKVIVAEETRAKGVESGLEERISAIEETVGSSDGKTVAEQISEAVAGVQADVDNLEETVNTKADTSTVTGLSEKVTTAEGEIDQLQTDLDAVEEAVATKASAEELTTLTGKVTTAENEIDTLQSEMDAVEEKATANEAAINTAEERITALEEVKHVEISNDEIDAMFV